MATNEPKYVTEPILTYYDAKIKKYIDEKAVQPQVELERRLDAVEKEAAVNATNITAHREELDDLEQDVRDLRSSIENIGSGNYVTNEYLQQNYSTTEQIAAMYVTEAEVNTVVNERIETKVTEVVDKVESGEIKVKKTEFLTYETF